MRVHAIGIIIAALLACALVPGVACADDSDSAADQVSGIEQASKALKQDQQVKQGSKESDGKQSKAKKLDTRVLQSAYALLKADGWLYRANEEGEALDDGSIWSGDDPLANVEKLFVDADVPALALDADSGIDYGHPAVNVANGFVLTKTQVSLSAAEGAVMPLSGLEVVQFKTDAEGASSCAAIGRYAFAGSPVQTLLDLDKTSVAEVGACAFSHCAQLGEIVLPDTCAAIGEDAFAGCSALSDVVLRSDDVVALANRGAFAGTPIGNPFDKESFVSVPEAARRAYCESTRSSNSWQRYRTKVVAMRNLGDARVKVGQASYTGDAVRPDILVQYGPQVLEEQTDYLVSYQNNTDAGIAQVEFVGIGKYEGQTSAAFVIRKSENEMVLKAHAIQADYYAICYEDTLIKHPVKVKKASGDITYKLVEGSDDAAISLDKKTGDITVAQGTPEGTYPIKVKVKASGDGNHNPASATVEFDIDVDKENSPPSAYKFMAIAQREYDEGIANGTGHRGDSKYWSAFVGSYQPWCSEFVGWCLQEAGLERGVTMPSNPSYAKAYYNFYKDRPEVATIHINDGSYEPQPGDIVLQAKNGTNFVHTEMITWSDGYNYGGISGGSRVSTSSRSLGNKDFYYFITINWDAVADSVEG